MRPQSLKTVLFAGLLLVGAAATALGQASDPHHPGEPQAAPGAPSDGPGETPAPGTGRDMPGMMGMMTPDMMRMMQGMMAMQRGGGGQPGTMAPGATMCPMMQMMGGMRAGGGMSPMTGGHAMLYGMPAGAQEEMTPERVRAFLAQRIAAHGNPRLKLGEIATAGDGSITAEIVTVDGSLVQKLAFNRYPGLFRQVP
jgi:hypothetical protein